MITDSHLANLLRQLQEHLELNRPVLAYNVFSQLEQYLAHKYVKKEQP